MREDLFKVLRIKVGCTYISDLRFSPWNMKAIKVLQTLDLREFTLQQLSEVARYMFGRKEPFLSYYTAELFFGKHVLVSTWSSFRDYLRNYMEKRACVGVKR